MSMRRQYFRRRFTSGAHSSTLLVSRCRPKVIPMNAVLRFTRLLAMVLVLAATVRTTHAQTPVGPKTAPTKTISVADADKLDINTATPAQLKALTGIGDAYSKRIIDGRPYTAKNQLTSRGIVPASTYDAIKDQIVARAPKK